MTICTKKLGNINGIVADVDAFWSIYSKESATNKRDIISWYKLLEFIYLTS